MVRDKRKQQYSDTRKKIYCVAFDAENKFILQMCTNAKEYICFPVHVTGIATTEKNARSAKKERKCRYPLSTFLQQSVPIPAFRNDFPQQETKSGPKKASTKKHKLESPQPKKKRAAKKQRENAYKCRYLLLISCQHVFNFRNPHKGSKMSQRKYLSQNVPQCSEMSHNVPTCHKSFFFSFLNRTRKKQQ